MKVRPVFYKCAAHAFPPGRCPEREVHKTVIRNISLGEAASSTTKLRRRPTRCRDWLLGMIQSPGNPRHGLRQEHAHLTKYWHDMMAHKALSFQTMILPTPPPPPHNNTSLNISRLPPCAAYHRIFPSDGGAPLGTETVGARVSIFPVGTGTAASGAGEAGDRIQGRGWAFGRGGTNAALRLLAGRESGAVGRVAGQTENGGFAPGADDGIGTAPLRNVRLACGERGRNCAALAVGSAGVLALFGADRLRAGGGCWGRRSGVLTWKERRSWS